MRKFAVYCTIAAIIAIVSGTIIQARHRDPNPGTVRIDTTEITQSAGHLPTVQVDEPF